MVRSRMRGGGKGAPALVASQEAATRHVVETESPAVQEARKTIIELLRPITPRTA